MSKLELYDWVKNFIINKKNFFKDKIKLDLTIIIFTYKRPECVMKSICYWAGRSPKIIIVDGSPKKDDMIIKITNKINNISYFHLPDMSIPERIRFAAKKSLTRFTMCQGDDDYYLISGIKESLAKISKNNSLVACMGQAIGLDYKNKKPYFFEYGSNLKNYKIKNKNIIRRLNIAFQNYIPAAFYAVFETKIFRNLWKNNKTYSCQEVSEYEHAFKTFLEGSLITSKKIYWIRSFQYKPKSSKIDGNRRLIFAEWLDNKKFKKERNILVNDLSNNIEKKTILNKIASKELVFKIFNLIVNNKNSLYKNYSILLFLLIKLKILLEKTYFRKLIKVFKRSFFIQALIEQINYFSRKRLRISDVPNDNQKKEIKRLLEFLNNCPS